MKQNAHTGCRIKCGMTTTDCLDCGGMNTLRNDGYRLPGLQQDEHAARCGMTVTDCLDYSRMFAGT